MPKKLYLGAKIELARFACNAAFLHESSDGSVSDPVKVLTLKHHLQLPAIKNGLGMILKMSQKPRSRPRLFGILDTFDAPHGGRRVSPSARLSPTYNRNATARLS